MFENYKLFLYHFDFIGITPRLFIFNNDRYKTILTSFISIFIILFSFIYTISSLVEYFKYENPIVSYSKSSDNIIEREIFLKNTFLMFQLVETTSSNIIDDSIAYFEGNYKIIYDDGNYGEGPIYIEKCEFGKNINVKYMSSIKSRLNFERPIETFYCISSKSHNISLFYKPNIGYSLINLDIIIKNNNYYIPEKILPLIISENNIIDHINKKKPISESFIYHQASAFNSLEYTKIDYVIQFIRYESDDGLFIKKNKIFNGISFSNMIFYRAATETYDLNKDLEQNNFSKIGTLSFEINKANYDYYKRNYPKLRALLAEIMSVISLVFEFGKQISFFICDKKMSQKIIEILLDKENLLNQRNYKKNNLRNKSNIEEKKLSSGRDKIENKLIDKKNNTDFSENNYHSKLNISKDYDIFPKNEINKNNNKKVFKKISCFYILKSYFCFKDKKTNLINLCHATVIQDLCVEKILERFYNIEKIYHFFINKEKGKIESLKIKRFKEIKKYIDEISNETKGDCSIKKEETKLK